jgi:hypothetical protein
MNALPRIERSAEATPPSAQTIRRPVEPDTATEHRLRCTECGSLSDSDAHGWRAYIAYLEDDGDEPEVVVYRSGLRRARVGDP